MLDRDRGKVKEDRQATPEDPMDRRERLRDREEECQEDRRDRKE